MKKEKYGEPEGEKMEKVKEETRQHRSTAAGVENKKW